MDLNAIRGDIEHMRRQILRQPWLDVRSGSGGA
jgi:hypothetical protein